MRLTGTFRRAAQPQEQEVDLDPGSGSQSIIHVEGMFEGVTNLKAVEPLSRSKDERPVFVRKPMIAVEDKDKLPVAHVALSRNGGVQTGFVQIAGPETDLDDWTADIVGGRNEFFEVWIDNAVNGGKSKDGFIKIVYVAKKNTLPGAQLKVTFTGVKGGRRTDPESITVTVGD